MLPGRTPDCRGPAFLQASATHPRSSLAVNHSTEAWKTLRWLSALAVVLLLGYLAVRTVEQGVTGTTAGVQRGLDQVLGALTHSSTRIVEGRAEVVERNEIAELSLVELRMSATRRIENEGFMLKYLPAGTKTLIARGHFRVTAGYRLEPGVSLRVEDGTPVASFPEPEILGVELLDFEVLSEQDGWANRITPADRSTLLRELRGQMRREAKDSGLLEMVEASLGTRLRDLLDHEEVRIERTAPDR